MGEKAEQTLAIDYVETEALIPYALNSRTHSEKQVAQIAASIQEFGFTNPVLIDERRTIIAGHGRVLAAQKLQQETVPTITLNGLSETQRKAYVIADNKLALNSGWDDELLATELEALQLEDFNLDLLGWDELPEFIQMPDYSVLEDDDVSGELNDMRAGVRKAIQIEFEPEHYEEAQEVIKWWRQQNAYIGMMLVDHLKKEMEKHEA